MSLLIFNTLLIFINVLEFLIIARAFLSWLPIGYDNPVVKIVHRLTEPLLGPIRNLLRRSIFGRGDMMIDFSPIIAFLLLQAVTQVLYMFFS